MASNRAMNSKGCGTRCVRRTPGYLVRYATDPSRKMLGRSLAIAGRKQERTSCSRPLRSRAPNCTPASTD